MKMIFFIGVVLYAFTAKSQTTFKAWETKITKDCTEESVLKEPGRFWDNHAGGAVGGSSQGFSAGELSNAKKMMQAFEDVCKPKLQFVTGCLAKASFGVNTKPFYIQVLVNSYTYNLGFHRFVCNVQTNKLRIVDEYQGVLRVKGNPSFQRAFTSYQGNAAAYQIPVNTQNANAPYIPLFSYYGFADSRVVNAINNGNGFIELNSETAGNLSDYPVIENKPGKGYGIAFPNGFQTMNNEFVYRHAFITHTDVPFFIPVTRKKFLQDMLEFYDREKPELLANMQGKINGMARTIAESEKRNSPYLQDQKDRQALQEQSLREITSVNGQKKQTVMNLLQSKDEKWLNQSAVIPGDSKAFVVPADRKRNLKEVYGEFYFTNFYTGTEGFSLYQVNPEYLKKHPPGGAKPIIIDVIYRFRPNDKLLTGVNENFINQLNLDEFRKLL